MSDEKMFDTLMAEVMELVDKLPPTAKMEFDKVVNLPDKEWRTIMTLNAMSAKDELASLKMKIKIIGLAMALKTKD